MQNAKQRIREQDEMYLKQISYLNRSVDQTFRLKEYFQSEAYQLKKELDALIKTSSSSTDCLQTLLDESLANVTQLKHQVVALDLTIVNQVYELESLQGNFLLLVVLIL